MIAGTPSCSGASGENPADSSQYIIRDDAGWSNINGSHTYYFVCPGDYTSAGAITISSSGTSGVPKWVTWWTDTGYSDTTHPYNMTTERAIVKRLYFTQANWWIIDRLSIIGTSSETQGALHTSNTNNIIFNALYANGQNLPKASGLVRIVTSGSITIQSSYLGECAVYDAWDLDAILTNTGVSHRFVNNEIRDCNHNIQKKGSAFNSVVENNDLYRSPDSTVNCLIDSTFDGSDKWTGNNQDNNGQCQCGESLFAMKDEGGNYATADNPMLIMHNRIWGVRTGADSSLSTQTRSCGRGRGSALVFQYQDVLEHTYIKNNIFDGFSNAILMPGGPGGSHSLTTIEGNLLANRRFIKPSHVDLSDNDAQSTTFDMSGGAAKNLVQFNTIVHGESQSEDTNNCNNSDNDRCAWLFNTGDNSVNCNTAIDAGSADRTTNLSGDYNQHIGDTEAATSGANDQNHTVVQANLTDFTYNRQLISGPELITITNAVPTDNSPFLNNCGNYSPPTGYGHK